MNLNFILRGLESSQEVDALQSHFSKVLCHTALSASSPVSFPPPGPKRFWLQVDILGAAHLRIHDSFCNGMK